MRLQLSAWLLAGTAGCADGPATSVGSTKHSIVYADDDRRDLYEVDSALKALAVGASVALVHSSRLSLDERGRVGFAARSLQEDRELCPDERFGTQPVLPFCSGVLIDDDLVLTAGHCFRSEARSAEEVCRATSFVFGFDYRAPDGLNPIGARDVHGCKKLVAPSSAGSNKEHPDYALVQLDRAAEGGTPAPLAARENRPVLEASLHLIGNGAGLPTKVDSGGKVTDASGETYLVADTDSFEGGSGSGVFDASFLLVAIQVRGLPDWQRSIDCNRAAQGDRGSEQHLLVSHVLGALCDEGYPSARLCKRASTCGDGVCTGDEAPETCDADCGPPCGDGACLLEERASCAADCAELTATPGAWLCSPWTYADGASCDCNCGAPDPDCQILEAPTTGCGLGQSCDDRGACVRRVPDDDLDLAVRAGNGCAVSRSHGNTATAWLVATALLSAARRRRAQRGVTLCQ